MGEDLTPAETKTWETLEAQLRDERRADAAAAWAELRDACRTFQQAVLVAWRTGWETARKR